MKSIIVEILIISCLISACSSGKDEWTADVEVIPVDVHAQPGNPYSFIKKMEILPLETKDSALVASCRKVIYDKDMDMYALCGRNQIVYIFDGQGRFLGDSEKVHGGGPEEYIMMVDMAFNPFVRGIDLLDPYGKVYTYSPSFEYIEKKEIQSDYFLDALMPLSASEYVFTIPYIWAGQEIAFVDFRQHATSFASYKGMISRDNTMDKSCFYREDDRFYYVPKGINYYFYEVDAKTKSVFPIMRLDFGDDEILDRDLPGRAYGKRMSKSEVDDEGVMNLLKDVQERGEYIRDGGMIIPLVKFFSDDYVYILFAEGRNLSGHYIYDRKRKQGHLVKGISPFYMQPCFALADNVLLAMCYPWQIHNFADERLMSETELEKVDNLKEEDNPVIIKYYLCD